MNNAPIFRTAAESDLEAVNAVIESAVMTWSLPDRVKRLSLASYRYDSFDLDHLHVLVAEAGDGRIIGVAAWEAADRRDTPSAAWGLLLHGLYVAPHAMGRGVGGMMVDAALEAAQRSGFEGVLVKANRDATGFFEARGFRRVRDAELEKRYPYLFWHPVG